MIKIEVVRHIKSGISPTFEPTLRDVCDLAISQHEEIERLKKEASEWKAFYFEALEKLKIVSVELYDAFERAASVCDEQESLQYATGCDECAVQARRDASFIRALKAGEPK